jgi:tetratricopeptide (TPR) repeat protein
VSDHVGEDALLSGACGPDLLHLLVCPACRSWAVGRLLAEIGKDEDETLEDYEAIFEALGAPSVAVIEEGRRRRAEAESLFGELMRMPPEGRIRGVRKTRFRSLVLLDHLLEASHAGQLTNPGEAAEQALLAFRLAEALGGDGEAAAALPRALCLGVNARRLLGDRQGADSLLGQASAFLGVRMDRAFHCRAAGLLRWEEGRTEEGMALLTHAAKLFAADDFGEETGTCRALLGLLHEEEGQLGSALPSLARGWAALDREIGPAFSLRVALALAGCLAEAEQRESARNVLKEAWRLYSGVTDPGEMLRVYWAEARALFRLGDREEALDMFESVRLKLLEEGSLPEAALVSLDFAVALAEAGRPAEAEKLAAGLDELPGREAVARALREITGNAERCDSNLRTLASLSAITLRRTFRLCGVWIKPLPFA